MFSSGVKEYRSEGVETNVMTDVAMPESPSSGGVGEASSANKLLSSLLSEAKTPKLLYSLTLKNS